MIKQYKYLVESEKAALKKYLNKSIEELDEIYLSRVYNFGEGVLIYFHGDEIIGILNVVLEVAYGLKTVYFHKINIKESSIFKEEAIRKLIKEGRKIADKYGTEKFLIAARDESTEKLLESIGINMQYAAFSMLLEDRSEREEILELEKLTESNKDKYLSIYNDSFNDMPHGTLMTDEILEEHLRVINEFNYFFIVCYNKEEIGFMECSIEEGQGKFDIGLCKEYRGVGYGKKLLETAIAFLNSKNVEKICLTVIQKNSIAFNMYKKRGFAVEKIISKWAELR